MKPVSLWIAASSLILASSSFASQDGADKLRSKWKSANEQWSLQMRAASTPEQSRKAASTRPILSQYVQDMWIQIGGALDKDWSLEYAAWYLEATQSLILSSPSPTPQFVKETDMILKAVSSYHMQSLKLTPMCMALANSKSSKALDLLTKIAKEHPNKEIQGVACLAAAISLKSFGDDPESIKKRLTYLKTAIIQSAHVKIADTTVAKIAEDEIYVLTYLGKGRVAPDLVGTDVAGRAIKLSDFSNKIVMLVFWNSQMDNYDDSIRLLSETSAKLKGKPFVILGVNNDPSDTLRKLESTDSLPFKSFSDADQSLAKLYRVGARPIVFVLDKERKIQYRGTIGSFAELTAEALITP